MYNPSLKTSVPAVLSVCLPNSRHHPGQQLPSLIAHMIPQKTSPLMSKDLYLCPPVHLKYPDHGFKLVNVIPPKWLFYIILKFRAITIYCNYDYLILLFKPYQFLYLINTSDSTVSPPKVHTCVYFLHLSLDPRAFFPHWPATFLNYLALLPCTDACETPSTSPEAAGTEMSVSTDSWGSVLTGPFITILSCPRKFFLIALTALFNFAGTYYPTISLSSIFSFFFTYLLNYEIFIERLLFARP